MSDEEKIISEYTFDEEKNSKGQLDLCFFEVKLKSGSKTFFHKYLFSLFKDDSGFFVAKEINRCDHQDIRHILYEVNQEEYIRIENIHFQDVDDIDGDSDGG